MPMMVKSCGKAHATCNVCRPEVGAKLIGHIPGNRRALDELLVINGHEGGAQRIKARLIKEGLIEDRCETCGMGPEWQGRPLVLPLDHRNGNRRDWRLENLRVLCPNCHVQTETFCRS